MKLLLLLCLILFSNILMGADIDLQSKLPEDFNWSAYFAEGDQSTGGEMFLAQAAAAILKRRIDELCAQYRALMTKRGEVGAVKLFDEMQEHWRKSASAEVALVGSAWDGGAGAKAAYPAHLFKVYLRRVKELKELKGSCLFLND